MTTSRTGKIFSNKMVKQIERECGIKYLKGDASLKNWDICIWMESNEELMLAFEGLSSAL